MSIISIIYDALAVLVVIGAIIKGAKNGFVKTAIQTIGYIFAAVAAFVTANIACALIYTAAIQPAVISAIENSLAQNANPENLVAAVVEAVENLPAISALLFNFEGAAENLVASVGVDFEKIAAAVEENAIRPVAEPVLTAVIFIVLLMLLTAVVNIIAKGSKVFNEVPVIGSVNSFFGGAAGAVGGMLELFVAAMIIKFVVSAGIFPEYFSEEIISQTNVFKWIYSVVSTGNFPI